MGAMYNTLISLQLRKRFIFREILVFQFKSKSNFVTLYYLQPETSVPHSVLFTKLTFAC